MATATQKPLVFLAPGDTRIPVDIFQQKITKLVADDSFEQELNTAIAHCEASVPEAPLGKSCAIATPEQIKDKCATADAHFSASGSLRALCLNANAIKSFDVATVKMVMEQAVSVDRLLELIGPIAINVDSWAGVEFKELMRADKDGYVHALCLILLWTSYDDALHAAVKSMARDLTFKFQKLGAGLGLLLKCMWVVCDLGSL
jgi:hypothetical protein